MASPTSPARAAEVRQPRRRTVLTVLTWVAVAVAGGLALAGYGVRPGGGSDPHSSFRCPPPLVSSWSHSTALERSRPAGSTPDSDVDVRCGPSARPRLALAAVAVVAAFAGALVLPRTSGPGVGSPVRRGTTAAA